MRAPLFLLAFLPMLLAPLGASAFPEMVRHHYVNCNACHVNPGGGGLLTEYGRMTAAELLSTWGSPESAMFLHGAINPEKFPKALNFGGDLRVLQVHREDRRVREGHFIVMQTSLEGAATVGPVTAVASIGKPSKEDRRVHPDVTRFYLTGSLLESLQWKAGRFVPAFGLNVPYHTLPTRGALGFGYDSERNGAEVHWSGEGWHGAGSVSQSRVQSRLAEVEKAVSFQAEKFLADSYRLGGSVWRGGSEKQSRSLVSLHGILGFTPSLYALSEVALQDKFTKAATKREKGIYQFTRLGYELARGWHLVGLQEFTKTNLQIPASQVQSFGLGTLWYPRPHFELELTFSQRRNFQITRSWEDYAYLMVHYYL